MWFKKKSIEPETGICAKCYGVFLKVYMKKVERQDYIHAYPPHGLPNFPPRERLYCQAHAPEWDREVTTYDGSLSYYKHIPERWEIITLEIEQRFY